MERARSNLGWLALAGALAIGLVVVVARGRREAEVVALDPVSVGDGPEEAVDVRSAALPAAPRSTPISPSAREAANEETSPSAAVDERGLPGGPDLVVRVVDLGGRPLAGVPVLLTPNVRRDGHTPGGTLRGSSDVDGLVLFAGERARLLGLLDGAGDPWWLQHEVAFEEPPVLELTEARLARELVESVQPPFGALEVRVFELDGEPAEGVEEVELELVRIDEVEDPSLARERRRSSAHFDGERALFPHVEPGRECVARARRQASELVSEARGAGPPRPGASARIDLRMGADRPLLELRALDERGRALAETELEARLVEHVFNNQSQRARTDAEGRFRLELDLELVALLRPWLELTTTGADGARRVGLWNDWPELEDGVNECGDVTLEPEQLLVGGRVLDERGQPVAGAVVRCGDEPDYDVESFRWQFQRDAPQTTSDADGGFAFRGTPRDDLKLVWALHPSYTRAGADVARLVVSAAVAFNLGDEELVLRVRGACRPSLRVLLPSAPVPDDPSDAVQRALSFELTPAETQEEAVHHESSAREGDTIRARFGATLPGRYDLACELHGEPLRALAGLELDESGDLGVLDLRDAFFLHALRLHAPRDADGLSGTWRLRPAGSDEEWSSNKFDGASLSIASTASAVDVELLPEGYAAELVLGLSGLLEVNLRPALRVRLVLVTDGPLPALPYVFDPNPSIDGRTVGRAEGSPYFTESKRESVFLLPRAGPVTVRWHFEKQLEHGAIGGTVLNGREVVIEVEDVPGEQRFELHLDGDALRRLVEAPPF